MECVETDKYAGDICVAVELELASLGCTQDLISAAEKHFAGTTCPPSHLPSSYCTGKLPILSAWRWLVRIPAKEALLNARCSPHSPDTSEPEGPMDLAYRCVLPSPLGYAIHKIDIPPEGEPTIEDDATLLDMHRLSKEAEDRLALWRAQRLAIMVVTALALGLRRLRAEVRRRVDAWKILAASAASAPQTPLFLPTPPVPQSQLEDHQTPRRRCSFHPAFREWATSSGVSFIRTLRWSIPPLDTVIERTRTTARCATHASAAKITEALINLGVPFATAYGPSWGPGFPEWNAARQLFHVPCNCEFPDEHPVTSVFARCRHCHGYSIHCEAPAQAPCKACGRSSDTVCAACHNGFHNMAQCGLRSGVNKEYFPAPTELFPVCPDCLWQWAQFLSTSPTQTSPLH